MIAIASDHAGYKLKQAIAKYFDTAGTEYKDYGTFSGDSCDYPVYAKLAGNAVVSGEAEYGILVCGTGIGMSVAANKIRGIRCALCDSVFLAERARSHNNANVLALGALIVDEPLALNIIRAWLGTEFEGGRHSKRVEQIEG
ncbi:MAG: ribose 5-phosphate isomerase B [Oscillospiraceae bacterium]|jgi:ribose 5-phosphate isomerase B|nr:ribose 5-phosphate isomerase B [Oscillospiraceae bacterium]